MDEPVTRMDVGGLDLDPAAESPQALGEAVRGAALGVGAGEPALERAQLANDLHAPLRVHERGIISGPGYGSIAGPECLELV